jgi:hypothetical protein
MNVGREVEPVQIVCHQHPFVSALEKMTITIVAAVESLGVCPIEPLHGRTQVGIGRAQKQMKMIAHQAERKDMEIEALNRGSQAGQKILPVLNVKEYILPAVTTRCHMIYSIRELNSPGPSHVENSTNA